MAKLFLLFGIVYTSAVAICSLLCCRCTKKATNHPENFLDSDKYKLNIDGPEEFYIQDNDNLIGESAL